MENLIKSSSKMKWSRYNYMKQLTNRKVIVFNCSTKNYIYITENQSNLIKENKGRIQEIKSLDNNLYELLIKNKFIINDDIDEVNEVIHNLKKEFSSPQYFELHINPTLDCNLRCWYCYETHLKGSIISKDILASILLFIKNKVESIKLEEITISFFGGEPLLAFNKVVWPIILYAKEICNKNHKKLNIFFNTNAVLLTKKIVNKLYSTGMTYGFQVPFDGNEEYHNRIKKFNNGKGSYEIIIENIMYALSFGFRFNIRCNYTSENLHSFDELISIFKNYASDCIKYGILRFSFHKVWQASQTIEMTSIVNSYESKTNLSDTNFYHCYADRENSIVINYNGDIFNCTANDFKRKDREGYLTKNGEIIYNEIHFKRMEARFSNKTCLNCLIFPICTVCTKTKLKYAGKDIPCLKFASDTDKEIFLQKRIQFIVNNKNIFK